MNSYYYCFNIYWSRFHFYNPKLRTLDKDRARKVWDKCNCTGKKKKLIDSLTKDNKIELSALNYLKQQLNKF